MIWLLFYVIVRLYSSHNVSGTRLRASTNIIKKTVLESD